MRFNMRKFGTSQVDPLSLMAKLVTRTEVLSAYRYLLRSTTIAFQGDIETLSAARKNVRKRFESGRQMAADSPEAVAAVQEARDVGKFLRCNIVQGIKDNAKDTYRTFPVQSGVMIRITDT
jgi:complex III assembly factor LYRM7